MKTKKAHKPSLATKVGRNALAEALLQRGIHLAQANEPAGYPATDTQVNYWVARVARTPDQIELAVRDYIAQKGL